MENQSETVVHLRVRANQTTSLPLGIDNLGSKPDEFYDASVNGQAGADNAALFCQVWDAAARAGTHVRVRPVCDGACKGGLPYERRAIRPLSALAFGDWLGC